MSDISVEGAMGMERVKDHFEDEAQDFDRIILKSLPNAQVTCIDFSGNMIAVAQAC